MKGTILLLLISISLQAQVTVTLRDNTSGLPVEGAQVVFKNSLNEQYTTFTNTEGEAFCHFDTPVKMEAAHISYDPIQLTINSYLSIADLTPSLTALEEVVVTGQYTPQSAKNSVYNVRTISAQRLKSQGANTLQDVLANELNIRFSRDNALGTSGISLQGVSGQNVKVLIDGVPMVGRSGVANEIDINQINVNTIERIEIVEGPMAVNFGADALAGVINIITKKQGKGKINATLSLQEETVESEYALFDEGIHNLGLTLGSNLNKNIYVQLEGRVNSFGGWIGDESQFTDRNRQWYPKDQYFGGAFVRYATEDFSIHYRMDYLDETIQNLGTVNDLDLNTEPFSMDQEYISNRVMHQVQSEFEVGKWQFNPVVSFTDYSRVTESFTTFLVSDLESIRRESQETFYTNLFFRNTASITDFSWGSLQLGVDVSLDEGGGSTLSAGDKEATDVAFFLSSEINVNDKLAIRPGVRYGYNSIFTAEPTPSVNVKYAFDANTQLRVGYGRGFRVPSLRELYHEFIDANHNIIGNPELTPEYSHNVNASLTRDFEKLNVSTTLSGFYNHIDDRITFFTPQESNAATTYLNLTEFRSTGSTFTINYRTSRWNINSGAAYIGRYQRLNEESNVPDFIFNWELNTNVSYTLPETKTTFSAFYKFNGPLDDYRLVDPDGDGEFTPELQGIEGFHLMDFTVNQDVAKSLNISLGARNIFNITAIDNNFSGGGAHSGTTDSTSVGYGTSFFLRLNYQFINQ